MGKYYTSQEHFERIFQNTRRFHAFCAEDLLQYETWSDGLRTRLTELTGMDHMRSCEPQAQLTEVIPCDGYTRKRLLIHTEEDVVMPFYMLVPNNLKPGERRTAVIACHGHSSNGKVSVAGVRDERVIADTIDHYHYNYGEVLAQMGYLVFAPDARGFGERRERYDQGEEPQKLMASSCDYLNVMAMSLGQTLTGLWVWDLMRLVDYALSLSCVNGHIACVGLSGGGMQSLWLGAMDTRVECCVVSGYFYGYLQSLLVNFNCLCNYVPGLWNVADIGDIGALLAPRPLLIETGDEDQLNGRDGLQNVIPQVDTVRQAMKLFGKEEHIAHDIFHGDHRWHGGEAYRWLIRHTPPEMEAENDI